MSFGEENYQEGHNRANVMTAFRGKAHTPTSFTNRWQNLHADTAKSTWDTRRGWKEWGHVAAHEQSSVRNATRHGTTTGARCGGARPVARCLAQQCHPTAWSASWHGTMLSCLSQHGVAHGFLPGMGGAEGPESHREELEQELCAPLSCHGRVNHQILHRAVARDDPSIFHYPAGPLSRWSYL